MIMKSIFSELLHKRVANDISAFDDARRSMESVLTNSVLRPQASAGSNRTALLSMLSALGINGIDLADDSNIFLTFKEILEDKGYVYTIVKLEDKWWKNSCGPMMGVSRENGVFLPLLPKGFNYYYPDSGDNMVRVTGKNASGIQDYAYCFYRRLPSESLTQKQFFRFMLDNIPKFHLWYVLVLSLVIAVLGTAIPYATKLIFDQVVPSGNANTLWALMLVLLNTALAIGLLSNVRTKIFMGVKSMMAVVAQTALFDRLYRLKATYFRTESAGTVTTQVLGASEACENLSEGLVTVVFTFLVSLVYLVQLFIFSHFSAIAYCLTLLLAVNILCIWIAFKVRNAKKKQWSLYLSRFNGLMYSYLKGVQKIRTNGAEARVFRNWAASYKDTIVFNFIEATFPMLSGSFMIAAIFLIVRLVPSTDMSVSDYAAFFSAYCGITAAVNLLGMYSSDFTYIVPAFNKVKPLLAAQPEEEISSNIVRSLAGNISIRDLHFRYSDDMPYIFNGLNLDIKAGEYVALVGHSGCGKSTLIRLMLGFETADSGSIYYDHYGIQNVNKSSLRQHLGICLQSGHLFSGTILDNVRVSNPYATEDEVWEALRIAAVDDEIRNMPDGLYHQVDASGIGVSGGQCQRILIARSVLNNPSVMFLDEATSALDNISQAKVIENLGKLNCTRITIAHRLSTIRECDRIIVLDGGRVAEEGPFDELIAKGGIFSEIAKRQTL